MTSQSPRIYTYKITFEEVPYYYYGVHKEKRFNEEYWGSPVTHRWCWELYTPKKQILEIFEFNDEGWLKAKEVEDRLIKPAFNDDKWCLNESCGGIISLHILRETGKKVYNLGKGIHGRTKKQMSEDSKKADSSKGGKRAKELKVGIFNLTREELSKLGSKGVKKLKQENKGIFSLTKEQRIKNGEKYGPIGGKKAAEQHKKNGTGFFGQTTEQKSEAGKKGGKIGGKIGGSVSGKKHKENKTGIFGLTPEQKIEYGKKGSEKTNAQKWKCLETGHITNAGALTHYQKARGIDTSKRIRIS